MQHFSLSMARDRHGARGHKPTLVKKVESPALQGCHLLLQCPTSEDTNTSPCTACPQPAAMAGDGQGEDRDLHKPLLSTLS